MACKHPGMESAVCRAKIDMVIPIFTSFITFYFYLLLCFTLMCCVNLCSQCMPISDNCLCRFYAVWITRSFQYTPFPRTCGFHSFHYKRFQRSRAYTFFTPNTHRRRDETVELRRVGGVYTPVSSRDPVYNFLCCWATEVGDNFWQVTT